MLLARITYVGAGVVIVDIDSDTCVCAKIDDIPLRIVGIGIVLLLGKQQDRIVIVALERGSIHGKELLPSFIDYLVNKEVESDTWLRKSHWVVRHSHVQRVLNH